MTAEVPVPHRSYTTGPAASPDTTPQTHPSAASTTTRTPHAVYLLHIKGERTRTASTAPTPPVQGTQ